MSWPAPARASDARSLPSSRSSEAAARMSGLAATVTMSADTCGAWGGGVIGCDAAGGA